ncbi:MAG: cell division protein FtsB [Gammaproteobacteria bacterium]
MKFINAILLILLVLLQYRLWNGNGSLPDVWRLEDIKAEQIEENEALTERNLSLTAEVMDLKEGMEAIEDRARSEMGMIQSGEIFYQIVERPRPSQSSIPE